MWEFFALMGAGGLALGYLAHQNAKEWEAENGRFLNYAARQYDFKSTGQLHLNGRNLILFDDKQQQFLAIANGLRKVYPYHLVTAARAIQQNSQSSVVDVELDVSDTNTPMLSFRSEGHTPSFILAKLKAHIMHLV